MKKLQQKPKKTRFRYDLIVWRMDELGITVDGGAPEIGISTHTLSKARTGKNLTVDKLRDVADGLGLSMKYLFDFELPLERAARAVLKEEAAAASSSALLRG
jgi:hypothetical protein